MNIHEKTHVGLFIKSLDLTLTYTETAFFIMVSMFMVSMFE